MRKRQKVYFIVTIECGTIVAKLFSLLVSTIERLVDRQQKQASPRIKLFIALWVVAGTCNECWSLELAQQFTLRDLTVLVVWRLRLLLEIPSKYFRTKPSESTEIYPKQSQSNSFFFHSHSLWWGSPAIFQYVSLKGD